MTPASGNEITSTWATKIVPVWENIDSVREAAVEYLESLGTDQDAIDAIIMVTCELIENAIRYGDFQQRAEVTVTLSERPNRILVEVENPLAAGDDRNRAKLEEMITWTRGFDDPLEAYLKRLEEVSERASDTESGLGLVRIAYEGQSTVDYRVDDGDTLSVSAEYQL